VQISVADIFADGPVFLRQDKLFEDDLYLKILVASYHLTRQVEEIGRRQSLNKRSSPFPGLKRTRNLFYFFIYFLTLRR
jgi:hypothetical protein